jgi:hypothetical protein
MEVIGMKVMTFATRVMRAFAAWEANNHEALKAIPNLPNRFTVDNDYLDEAVDEVLDYLDDDIRADAEVVEWVERRLPGELAKVPNHPYAAKYLAVMLVCHDLAEQI